MEKESPISLLASKVSGVCEGGGKGPGVGCSPGVPRLVGEHLGPGKLGRTVELFTKLVQQVLPRHAGLTETLKISRRLCGADASGSL